MINDSEIQLMVGRLQYSEIDYTIESSLSYCQKGVTNLGVTWEEVLSCSRKRRIVDARRLCCSYLRNKGWTYDMIANYIGYQNHATVLHHCRRAEELLNFDDEYQRKQLKFQGQ